MSDTFPALGAMILAGIILARVICVVYQTTPKKHRHPVLFVGFGYSYIILGAGAAAAAVSLAGGYGYEREALWLMMAGSCGLIVFDRRAARCWAVTDCPLDAPPKGPP